MAIDYVLEAYKSELKLARNWKTMGMKLVPSCSMVHRERGMDLVPIDEYIKFWEDAINGMNLLKVQYEKVRS